MCMKASQKSHRFKHFNIPLSKETFKVIILIIWNVVYLFWLHNHKRQKSLTDNLHSQFQEFYSSNVYITISRSITMPPLWNTSCPDSRVCYLKNRIYIFFCISQPNSNMWPFKITVSMRWISWMPHVCILL